MNLTLTDAELAFRDEMRTSSLHTFLPKSGSELPTAVNLPARNTSRPKRFSMPTD